MSESDISIREKIREIMEPYKGGSEATLASMFMDIFIIASILCSCAIIPLCFIYPEHEALFWEMEIGFTLIFCVEYLLRWYSAPNRIKYPFDKFAIIDLLAILPTLLTIYAEMLMLRILRGVRLLRLLRLLRLIRLLKFFRYGFLIYRGVVSSTIWFSTFREKYRVSALERLFVLTFSSWVIGSNLLYLTESRISNNPGPFSDYWDSYWHTIIVLISGIEDKEPLSILGRIEVTALLIAGICIVGMLTGEIVSILVKKIQRAGMITLKPPRSKLKQHIVIFGNNMHLDNVIRQINAATRGRHYILLVSKDAHILKVTDPKIYKNVLALQGDPLQLHILEKACLDKALRVVVLTDKAYRGKPVEMDRQTMMETLAAYGHNRFIPMVVELKAEASLRYADTLDEVEFIVSRYYGEKLAAQAVVNPGVTEVYNSLMNFTDDSNEFYTIPAPVELIGKSFKQAQHYFLDMDDESLTLIGIDRSPSKYPNTDFVLCPVSPTTAVTPMDLVIGRDDRLLLIAFERLSFGEINKEDLWSGRVLARD